MSALTVGWVVIRHADQKPVFFDDRELAVAQANASEAKVQPVVLMTDLNDFRLRLFDLKQRLLGHQEEIRRLKKIILQKNILISAGSANYILERV